MAETGTQLVQAKAEPQTGTAVRSVAFDPFSLMDRLDEHLLVREMEGIAANDLVYKVKDKRTGKEQKALSKVGIDEACNHLAKQGHVIREERIEYEIDDERGEAYFRVLGARYAVAKDGREVRLDTAWGVKRQPMFFDGQELSLQAKCPFKKHRGKPWSEVLETDRSYVEWVAGNPNFDEDLTGFATAILAGEAPVLEAKRPNPHWYEHGVMKAARNARSRLVGAEVKATIMALAEQAGRVREISSDGGDVQRESDRAGREQARARVSALLPALMDDAVWSVLAPSVKEAVNAAEALREDPGAEVHRLENAATYLDKIVKALPPKNGGGSQQQGAETDEDRGSGDEELDRMRREYFHRVGELGWNDEMRKTFQKETKVYSTRYAGVDGMRKLLDALAKHEGKAE